MKYFFPPQNQGFRLLQTNRSDNLGSLWSTFNQDYQTNLGTMRLSRKLVINTSSATSATLGLPVAFEYFDDKWWTVGGNKIFTNSNELLTSTFSSDITGYNFGDATTQFDVTNPIGTTFRYTYDGTGTNPGITALTFPIGAQGAIISPNLAAGNNIAFTVTGSGSNYFEVTNASGVVESNKVLGASGYLYVLGGSTDTTYNSTQSDLKVFNNGLWSTSTDKLYLSSATGLDYWTVKDTLGASGIHQMVNFKKYNRLYYVDDIDTISSISTTGSVANSAGSYYLDLSDSELPISCMESNSQYIWIGTRRLSSSSSNQGTIGAIYQWDGLSSQPTNEYKLPTAGVLAITVHNDIPYAIDTEGRILKYTGYSFEEIQRLPINQILLQNATDSGQPPVHFNGFIATKDDTLLVAVNNLNDNELATVNENLPSGIWELDLATLNFTHRYSFTLKTLGSSTVTDYGQNKISAIGAIKLNTFASSSSAGRSELFAGCTCFTDATNTQSAVYITTPNAPSTDNEGQKRGYIVTTYFEANDVQDLWSRIWAVYKRFSTSTDKLIFKYRFVDEKPVEANITWTSTTTFTTTTNVSAYAPTATPFDGTTGGEVEVLQGTGSGSCTHITSITESMGTYTVTLDTPVTGVTGTAKARFQKWIKIFPEITGQVLSYGQVAIGKSDTTIQIKLVMEFTGDGEFMKFIIATNEDIKSTL
jgi:hypothetical protein